MSVGPMSGVLGSAAGAPLSQTSGSETERSAKDASATQRKVTSDNKADQSAGIGQTEGDQATSERDADGRRLWEDNQARDRREEQSASEPEPPRQAKDPSGMSGGSLDLTG